MTSPSEKETAATQQGLAIWCDETDWVIAASAEDALAVWVEMCGERDEDLDPFERWPDDKPLTIVAGEDPDAKTTMLPREWIAQEGRGWLCSTEY